MSAEKLEECTHLGAGGFGTVQKCKLGSINVAKKTMIRQNPFSSLLGMSQKQLYEREVHNLKLLVGKPNIIQYVTDFKEGNDFVIVTQLAAGHMLQQVIFRNHEHVRKTLETAANGVFLMHEVGLVHGDLKPDNIFVDDAGNATILDVGGACGSAGKSCVGIFVLNMVQTPVFAEPTMFSKNLAPVSKSLKRPSWEELMAGDVYSLGLTIFVVSHGNDLPYFPQTDALTNPLAAAYFPFMMKTYLTEIQPWKFVNSAPIDDVLHEMMEVDYKKRPDMLGVKIKMIAKKNVINTKSQRPLRTDPHPVKVNFINEELVTTMLVELAATNLLIRGGIKLTKLAIRKLKKELPQEALTKKKMGKNVNVKKPPKDGPGGKCKLSVYGIPTISTTFNSLNEARTLFRPLLGSKVDDIMTVEELCKERNKVERKISLGVIAGGSVLVAGGLMAYDKYKSK